MRGSRSRVIVSALLQIIEGEQPCMLRVHGAGISPLLSGAVVEHHAQRSGHRQG